MGFKDLSFPADAIFLVTGGAGFIGSNLCEAILALGHRVRCLDNLSTGRLQNFEPLLQNPAFDFIEGDIRCLETCQRVTKGVEYVLHQAAWGSVPRSIAMPLLYEEVNIRGTLNMMEAAHQNGVKKFVYASSSSVYGDHPGIPKREGEEGRALSPYAVTKRTNEEYGRLYAELYGLNTYGLRYFNVFGRRQDPSGEYAAVIPRFISMLMMGQRPVINGDGRQSRDFTYIDNVIEANLKACQAPASAAGQVFNISCGDREYLLDVLDVLMEALGKHVEPILGPERAGDIKHSCADIQKARVLLGYSPDYGFAEGLALAIDWYQANLGL